MKTFKEYILTEGTDATITVLEKGVYKTSFLQYNGYLQGAGKELFKNYSDPKKAKLLVQGTGEIRDIFDLEFYTDRTLLETTKDEKKAVKNANESYIKYFFDGSDWYYAQGQILDFYDEMDMLEDRV
jgi:hypothetical protein